MLVLTVTSTSSIEKPAILFNEFDRITNLQAAILTIFAMTVNKLRVKLSGAAT